jgi:hypothetical protein
MDLAEESRKPGVREGSAEILSNIHSHEGGQFPVPITPKSIRELTELGVCFDSPPSKEGLVNSFTCEISQLSAAVATETDVRPSTTFSLEGRNFTVPPAPLSICELTELSGCSDSPLGREGHANLSTYTCEVSHLSAAVAADAAGSPDAAYLDWAMPNRDELQGADGNSIVDFCIPDMHMPRAFELIDSDVEGWAICGYGSDDDETY